ncbi:MAG: hypothetical protein ABH952_02030 [Candidatus Omnitrophota bacterium]
MKKNIIPQKVVIEFNDGSFYNGVIMYRINDNGVISKTRSIGIKDAGFSKPVLNGILQKVISHARKAEAIDE